MACYDRGRRLATPSFILYVRARERDADWRVGFAVSKKVASAVGRNRVKRVLREFFRLRQQQMPQARDIVVIAKRGLNPRTLTLAQAEAELQPLVDRGFGGGRPPKTAPGKP